MNVGLQSLAQIGSSVLFLVKLLVIQNARNKRTTHKTLQCSLF